MEVVNKLPMYKTLKDLTPHQLFSVVGAESVVYCCVSCPDENRDTYCLFNYEATSVSYVDEKSFTMEPLVFYEPEDVLMVFGATEELKEVVKDW